jgi:hypothetical protein
MRQLTGGASVPTRDNADILAALNSVAASNNVDPAAIAAMIHTESVWDPTCVSTIYIGLTQVGPEFVASLKLTKQDFLALTSAQQITIYGKWLAYYTYLQQCTKYKMNVVDQPIARQAAVLQAEQFAPNGSNWKIPYAAANYSVQSTTSKQARVLGNTSIHDMEAYYAGFFQKYPPTYADDQDVASLSAALPRTTPQAAMSLVSDTDFQLVAEAPAPSAAGDQQHISGLIAIASDPAKLVAAQHVAAGRLLRYDREIYPNDGCAITLSVLLQQAGIAVADTYRAFDLGNLLKSRGWRSIAVGQQRPGDVGSTCGAAPHHGTDHIYLVLKTVNSDEMVIADNQSEVVHFRWASGKGKSPTTFFLRAV